MRFIALTLFLIGAARCQYHYEKPSVSIDSSSSSAISETQALPNKESNNKFMGYNYQRPSGGSQFSSSESSSSQFAIGSSSSSSSSGSSSSGFQESSSNLKPIITKSYFAHEAPPEPEEESPNFNLKPLAPRKHYNIIFIKTPIQKQVQRVVQQNAVVDDKTLVYVLSQTPEAAEDIELPIAEAPKPSKPEVYFIKYSAKKKQAGGDLSSIGSETSAVSGQQESQFNLESGSSSSSSSSSSSQTGFESYGVPN